VKLPPGGGEGDVHRLAVLGADGFIGSAVVRAGLEARLRVTAIALKHPWRLDGLTSPRLRHLAVAEGRWWLPHRDEAVAGALRECDSLALLAYTPPPAGDEEPLRHEREVNLSGARAVAEIAGGGGRVVFTSSADVYGRWHAEPVTESTEPDPARPYAAAKLEAEAEIQRICDRATCLRIATVYGPGENGPRAIPSFIRAFANGDGPVVHGDGSDVHDYIHVDDVAAAIVAAAVSDPPSSLYNLGSGVGRTTLSVLEAVAAAMDRPARARHVEGVRAPARLVLDTTLIGRELRLGPRVPFEEGLRGEVEWLLAHREQLGW